MKNNSNFFKLFLKKEKLINNIKAGSCILVKILKFKGKFILVDGNLKSFFFLKNDYIKENKYTFYKGKYIKVLIESLDDGNGVPKCSRNNYIIKIFWNYIKYCLKNFISITGVLLKKIKGGFSILLNKVKCFLPFSEVDKRILLNYHFYKRKEIRFNIISFNQKKKNIILSRKSLLYNFFYKKKVSLINFLKTGYIVKGIVKGISSYGFYVDLGYLDGLILNKNITWGPYKYSNEVIEINKGICAKILKIDKNKNRIYLGMKQIIKNPWKNIYSKYKIGTIRYARVFRITNDNIYMIFEKGVFSFLKKTKLINNFKDRLFLKNVKVNNYVLVYINYINTKRRFIGFKIYHKKKKKKKIKIIKKIIKIKKIKKILKKDVYLEPLLAQ
ncbi:30S ribosomal protein S1 [Candidatus Nasuia deltocephalinicola]|nr:30S ribosomal protein S1 [Candidatus Nasuia deltocephalinicola]